MYRRLYIYLPFNNKNIIYDLQYGFRQQYSTSHDTLINITENIRKTLDDGNIGCEVFDCRLAKSF